MIGHGSRETLQMLESHQDSVIKYSKRQGGEPVLYNELPLKPQTRAYLLHKAWHHSAYEAVFTDHVIRAAG